jgi:hypothetical protein
MNENQFTFLPRLIDYYGYINFLKVDWNYENKNLNSYSCFAAFEFFMRPDTDKK